VLGAVACLRSDNTELPLLQVSGGGRSRSSSSSSSSSSGGSEGREVTTDVVVLRQYDCAYVDLRNYLGG